MNEGYFDKSRQSDQVHERTLLRMCDVSEVLPLTRTPTHMHPPHRHLHLHIMKSETNPPKPLVARKPQTFLPVTPPFPLLGRRLKQGHETTGRPRDPVPASDSGDSAHRPLSGAFNVDEPRSSHARARRSTSTPISLATPRSFGRQNPVAQAGLRLTR